VRRINLLVAVAAVISPACVIREKDNDVWPLGSVE